MLIHLTRALVESLEILAPRECLVCSRPLRSSLLCRHCTPTPAALGTSGRCLRCFSPLASNNPLAECATCELFPPLFDSARYLWEYGGLPRDLIKAMKYRPSIALTRMVGAALADALPTWFPPDQRWDLVIPIPASPHSVRKRFFHPCFELARTLRPGLHGAPVASLLRHRTRRSPQAHRSHQQRIVGISSMFEVCSPLEVAGARVLVVEDVMTTGATVAAALIALRRAGAASVDLVAVAQTAVWQRFRGTIQRLTHGACARIEAAGGVAPTTPDSEH